MKNWKRLTALGLSAMMLASLAGCSTTTSKTDPESGKNQAAENTGGSGKESLEGAQTDGVAVNPSNSVKAVLEYKKSNKKTKDE